MNTLPTILRVGVLSLFFAVGGCTQTVVRTDNATHDVVAYDQTAQNGNVPYIWEEPMVDVVDVPPGLDPEGHYYRPAHQSIVEIRQGRWQYYKQNQQ